MKKVTTFILNNLRWLSAIVVFGITLIVIGANMLGSYNNYKAYEKRYNENDLAVRSAAAAAAQKVEINNNFSSKLKNHLEITADEMVTAPAQEVNDGYIASFQGKIDIVIDLDDKSFVDLEFVVRVSDDVEDLFANVNFRVNDSLMEDEVTLPGGNFEHLVLFGFALPEGKTTISVEAKNNKLAAMPDVESITFHSNAGASIHVDEVEEYPA